MTTYTGSTSFQHLIHGGDITVHVTFRVCPAEADVNYHGGYEVTDYTHDGKPMTSDEGAVDDHVDGLTPEWFAEVIRAAVEDEGDHRYHMMKEG